MKSRDRKRAEVTWPASAAPHESVRTSEAEDLRSILAYLEVRQSSVEAQRITGLSKSAISEVLGGKRARNTRRRQHIAVVAAIVHELAATRLAATGSAERRRTGSG